MKRFSLFFIILSILGGFVGCQRDDDEPVAPIRRISRLYISTADYDGNGGRTFNNVFVVDPADSNVFPPLDAPSPNDLAIYKYASSARGGGFINYAPFSGGIVFQSSKNTSNSLDTAIQVMTVSNTGILSNRNKIATRKFDRVRGIHYAIVSEGQLTEDYLLILNASDSLGQTLYAVPQPASQGFYTKPRYTINLDYSPWGINVSGRDVFVSKVEDEFVPNSKNGIVVYKDLVTRFFLNPKDSLITGVARFDLAIEGASNIRGISYSKSKDLLVVTDYAGTDPVNYKGRILFFDNFSKHTSSKTISPNRIINSTSLKQPLDVAIDTRADGKFIYVADAVAKLVFRFLITDEGADVKPSVSLNLNRTPQSLSLDAR